ncbi:MAG: DNA replication/repair protein RecF [Promicromonosporaceae bacterium]|nr:DNA replication/repair protein RecF [Promicromonosporaceae bacterium]
MYVSHLSLLDFRNHPATDLELPPGPVAFVGRNGQGKTNLVEAVGYVATLSSHRVPHDAPLIRAESPRAVVRTQVVRGDRASSVELEITAGRANRARINRGQLVPAREVLGLLRTVLFAPEDLALVKGDPDGRRRFLDTLLVQLLPRISGLLADFEKVSRQRSALLKSLRTAGGRADLRVLEVWNARAAELGGEIRAYRLQLLSALAPLVAEAYTEISDAASEASVDYVLGGAEHPLRPGEVETDVEALISAQVAGLAEQLAAAQSREIERGMSLVGPGRDDLALSLDGLPAKGYASHGESWSLALALRLASYRLLSTQAESAASFWVPDLAPDPDPVLILDDVFAELDLRRREALAALVAPARQVLITAAVPADVPAELLATRFAVEKGQVTSLA